MRPACEPNIKLRLKTTPQRVALAKMSLCSRKTSTPRRVVRVLSGAAPPPRSQERRTSLTLPKGKGKSLGQLGQRRCSAGDSGAACDRAGRRALTSASSLHCGSEGNSNFTSSMVPGPRRVGAVRPAAPRAGRGDKGRRAGGGRADARRAHSKHLRTTGSRRLRQEGKEQGGALLAAMLRPSPSRRSPRPSDSRDPAQARAHNRLLPPQPTCHSQSQPTLADGPPPPPPGVSAPPPCRSASAQTRGEGPPAGRSCGGREGGEVRAQAVCCQAS